MVDRILPTSNVTFRQVERLRRRYEELCLRGQWIVAAYEHDPSSENLDAMCKQAKAVNQAYRLWDMAHRECYGF